VWSCAPANWDRQTLVKTDVSSESLSLHLFNGSTNPDLSLCQATRLSYCCWTPIRIRTHSSGPTPVSLPRIRAVLASQCLQKCCYAPATAPPATSWKDSTLLSSVSAHLPTFTCTFVWFFQLQAACCSISPCMHTHRRSMVTRSLWPCDVHTDGGQTYNGDWKAGKPHGKGWCVYHTQETTNA
jgi:hypothetical protein